MKKWRLLIVLCCMAVWIAGCSKENKDDESSESESIVAVEVGSQGGASQNGNGDVKTWDTRIAVCLPETSEGWSHDVEDEAESKLGALNAGTDYILYTTTGALDQAQQIRGLLNEDVDAVVLYPLDAYSSGEALAQLKSAGTSIVLFNGSVGGITPTVQMVLNSETLGEMAAGCVLSSETAPNVLAFTNESSADGTIAYRAFENNLSEDISIIQGGNTGGDAEMAKSLMIQWLGSQDSKTLKSVSAIFAPDEVSLRGIMEGLLEYEELPMTTFPNLTVIVGCGMDQEVCKMIQEHSSYPIRVFGYSADSIEQAIDSALGLALGDDVAEVINVSVEEITKDNVNKYIK